MPKDLVKECRGVNLQDPAVLLKKYKFLRPDLVPEVKGSTAPIRQAGC